MPWHSLQGRTCTDIGDTCLSHVIKTKEFFIHPRTGIDQDSYDDTLYQLTDQLNNLLIKANESKKTRIENLD
jgi:hypothetical protein